MTNGSPFGTSEPFGKPQHTHSFRSLIMSTDTTKTEVGSYFISNYPPFSQWTPENVAQVQQAFASPPTDVPLGLYLHIPFCRKRCKFCYFKVFTDKNAP